MPDSILELVMHQTLYTNDYNLLDRCMNSFTSAGLFPNETLVIYCIIVDNFGLSWWPHSTDSIPGGKGIKALGSVTVSSYTVRSNTNRHILVVTSG